MQAITSKNVMGGKNFRDEIGPKLKKSVVISKQSQKVYKRVEKTQVKENINNYVNFGFSRGLDYPKHTWRTREGVMNRQWKLENWRVADVTRRDLVTVGRGRGGRQ